MAQKKRTDEGSIFGRNSTILVSIGVVLCITLNVFFGLFYGISYFYYFGRAVPADKCLHEHNEDPVICTAEQKFTVDPASILAQVGFFASVPTFIMGLQKLYIESDIFFERFFGKKWGTRVESIMAASWSLMAAISYLIVIVEPFANDHTAGFIEKSLIELPKDQFLTIIGFIFATALMTRATKVDTTATENVPIAGGAGGAGAGAGGAGAGA